MNTETVAAEVVADTTAATTTEVARDFESEARKDGWRPEGEFKPGDKRPPVILEAEAFVKKGEEIAAFTRKENKALRKEVEELKKSVDDRVSKLDRVHRANYDREVASYEREIKRLNEEKYKAVEAGDVPTVKRLDAEIGNTPFPEEIEPPAKGEAAPDKDAIVAKFKEANAWYETDEAMTAYAEGFSQKLAKDSGDKMPLDKNLKLVEAKMRELFPQHYKTTTAAKPNGHAAVDGGGDFQNTPGNPLFKLGNAERAVCKADMEKYPKDYPTVAKWLAVYEKK